MEIENHLAASLSKEQILDLLSDRLSCSIENLNFLIEQPALTGAFFSDIIIPDGRELLKLRGNRNTYS